MNECEKKDLISKYKDSTLPLEDRVKSLVSLLTLDEKISLLPTAEAAIERLNISEYGVGGEAAHGVVSNLGPSTVFPQPQGLACTFNKNLLKEIGSVIGDEARIYYDKCNRKYGLTLWAPTIDMERDPRWGRNEEAYGEDPVLTGKLSSNLIRGMEGDDDFYLKLVPAPKHFYGNNNEEGRIYCSSTIDKRNKYEYYLKAFKPAFVEGKAKSMMTAYNSVNGVPCILNREVQDIVKDTWGCDGFIVCDGGDFSQTVDYHKYYKTHGETLAGALKAGVDCFTDNSDLVISSAKEALEKNLITEEHINKAVSNILRVRFRLGEFDDDSLNPYSNIPKEKLCCKEHSDLALKACLESIVLLENKNDILPLNEKSINSIAVVGPLANVLYKDWYCGTPPYKITLLDGIKNKLKSKEVKFHTGNDIVKLSSNLNNNLNDTFELCDWGFNSITLKNSLNNKYLSLQDDDKTVASSSDDIWGWFVKEIFKSNNLDENHLNLRSWNNEKIFFNSDSLKNESNLPQEETIFTKEVIENGIEESVKLAASSDAAIVVVGNHPLINSKEEIDRSDLILPPHEEALIKSIVSVNPNTIVVVMSGYPFAINWCKENAPAVLYCTHGCQELGTALTKCIFGDYNPAGRLPMTWYKSVNDLPSINNYDIINSNSTYMYFKGDPLYEFGYGLSYTKFKYSNLIINSTNIKDNESITVDVLIENTGHIAGDEVVQIYGSLNSKRAKRPLKQLLDFERIHLQPSECKWITFTINSDSLKYFDVSTDKFILESGKASILVGSSSKDIHLTKEINIIGETLEPRNLLKSTKAENYDCCFNIILDECSKGGTSVKCESTNLSWLKFSDVYFEKDKNLLLEGNLYDTTTIEVKIDNINNPSIGSLTVSDSTSYNAWNNFICQLCPTDSIHDLYVVIKGNCLINSLQLI